MKFLNNILRKLSRNDAGVTTVGRNNTPVTFKDSMEGSEVAQEIFNIVKEESCDGRADWLLREFYIQLDEGRFDDFFGKDAGRKTGEKQHERDLHFALVNNENCGKTVHQVVNEVFARLILEKKGAFKAIGLENLHAEGMSTVKIEGMRRWDPKLIKSFGMENIIEMSDEQADRLQWINPEVLRVLGGENCKKASVDMLQGIQNADTRMINSIGGENFVQLSDEQRMAINHSTHFFGHEEREEEKVYLERFYERIKAVGGEWITQMEPVQIQSLLKEVLKEKKYSFDAYKTQSVFSPDWLKAMGGENLSQLDMKQIREFTKFSAEKIEALGGGKTILKLDNNQIDTLTYKDRETGEDYISLDILQYLGSNIADMSSESLGYLSRASIKLIRELGTEVVVGLGSSLYQLCESTTHNLRHKEMPIANIKAFGAENFLEMRNYDKVNWVRNAKPRQIRNIGSDNIIAMSIAELEIGNTNPKQIISESTAKAA